MVTLRPTTTDEPNANQVSSEYRKWCNNRSDCMYKDKDRKYHSWINLDNLTKKNKVAQCGYDSGDCDHTTHYGWGGYHNVCPIAGMNGDYVWPAKVVLGGFNFAGNNITSSATIKSISVHFEHRMVAVDTGSGTLYDNFGPTFHSDGGWAVKVYFVNGSKAVSKVKTYGSNPKLSKTDFSSVNFSGNNKFTDITTAELLNKNFGLVIEYNHNYNTNPGIIYLRNVTIDVQYEDAQMYITGSQNTNTLNTNTESVCRSTITQTIEAGYKNANGKIAVSKAPKKLGPLIRCISKPEGVTVTQTSQTDLKKTFTITDTSGVGGNKVIKYDLNGYPKQTYTLKYNAIAIKKPSYSFVTEYKSNEDFDPSTAYAVFKNGCASSISIYIDSITSTPINLSVANQNSSTNLLNSTEIQKFHTAVKGLSCGYHTLYIKRGDETLNQAKKNKVTIKIKPMEFKFKVYTEENSKQILEFTQSKKQATRYSTVLIKRIDNEPMASIPRLTITDETSLTNQVDVKTNVKKGDVVSHSIDKYYAGDFFIKIKDDNPCSGTAATAKLTINSNHKQNFDYLFTRGENGTAFDCSYLVAWEGDNVKEPLIVDSIDLHHSIDSLRICSNSVEAGLSQIGLIELKVKNKTEEDLEGIELELNVLAENDDDELEVTTSEWTTPDGIFNQFYTLFEEYNLQLNKNVEILNLTPDNDFVDEENIYLFIHKIEAEDTITIYLPFRSTTEKTVYLQYLLFEQPLKINQISDCDSLTTSANDMIQIDICDSMLTNLEIYGNTDLLLLDRSYNCPTECYTTKDVNELYQPIADEQSGGITYKITNIDTNDFDSQLSKTQILNDNELKPYGYIVDGKYYALLDNNNQPITVQETRPMLDTEGNQLYNPLVDNNGELILDNEGNIQDDLNSPMYYPNKLVWTQKRETINRIMANQNVVCHVKFPGDSQETVYTVKTNKKGLAEFYIPIPTSLNTRYTVNELLTNVLYFEFKENEQYNKAILTKKSDIVYPTVDPNKDNVIIDYGNNYKRYKSGTSAYIPIFLSADISIIRNYFDFNAELRNNGDSDKVTILYKICNLDNNEGIFKTTFKTNDKKLIPNQISKNIYCGINSDIDVKTKIEKKIIELTNINIIYIDVRNKVKENKDVQLEINLGKIPFKYLGNYDFLDINIDAGDYSIIEEDGNIHINWLIGEMSSYEVNSAIIKIKAQDIGLSNIQINTYDYLHGKNMAPIEVKQSKCNKCDTNSTWRIQDSPWAEFDGVWYKLFSDGTYKRPVKTKVENGKYIHEWVDKR